MIETTMRVETSPKETIQALLRRMLEGGVVDAWLVPVEGPGGSVAPMLVKDGGALAYWGPIR
jgi:hypothetical protein